MRPPAQAAATLPTSCGIAHGGRALPALQAHAPLQAGAAAQRVRHHDGSAAQQAQHDHVLRGAGKGVADAAAARGHRVGHRQQVQRHHAGQLGGGQRGRALRSEGDGRAWGAWPKGPPAAQQASQMAGLLTIDAHVPAAQAQQKRQKLVMRSRASGARALRRAAAAAVRPAVGVAALACSSSARTSSMRRVRMEGRRAEDGLASPPRGGIFGWSLAAPERCRRRCRRCRSAAERRARCPAARNWQLDRAACQ